MYTLMTYFPFPLFQDQHSYAQTTRLPSKLFLDQLIYKRITNPVLFRHLGRLSYFGIHIPNKARSIQKQIIFIIFG